MEVYPQGPEALRGAGGIPPRGATGGGGGRAPTPKRGPPRAAALVEQFEFGLDAPICLTWELTYACNLACVHCLSTSGAATRAS